MEFEKSMRGKPVSIRLQDGSEKVIGVVEKVWGNHSNGAKKCYVPLDTLKAICENGRHGMCMVMGMKCDHSIDHLRHSFINSKCSPNDDCPGCRPVIGQYIANLNPLFEPSLREGIKEIDLGDEEDDDD